MCSDVPPDDEEQEVDTIHDCASCGLPITAAVDEYYDGEQRWHRDCAVSEHELME
ncbi:hypothetical protein NVP1031O_021 [Vibrio phage 1.031.O._10N.261.46.F8]|nr:hypothetical protein NVP1031O_021 [Vibrio phage 1.031.O._10N.261.46.F8]